MTSTHPWALALLLAVPLPAFGQAGVAATPNQDEAPARRADADLKRAFFALQDEYDEAYDAYREVLVEIGRKRREDPNAQFERPAMPQPAFFDRFVALADQGSAEANLWVLQNHGYGGWEGEAARADKHRRVLRMLAGGSSSEELTALTRVLAGDTNGRGTLTRDEALSFLEILVGCTDDPEVQAGAAYAKASGLGGRTASEQDQQASLAAMRSVVERWPHTAAGKRADGQLFSMEKLNIGQTAPEIVGQDVDGNAMKLSDFAGKVVVLDFWGFW